MCGILALFNILQKRDIINKHIIDNFKIKNYRGPDNTHIIDKNSFLLGFHRLAINGLDEDSNQPFVINNKMLICNGEIYNHRDLYKENPEFVPKTHSDCEIIIYLYEKYGIEATCNMLDGVFAFVLIDLEKSKVFVARDPFGVRPLFEFKVNDILNNDNFFGFCSEMKYTNSKFFANLSIRQFKPGTIKKYTFLYNFSEYTSSSMTYFNPYTISDIMSNKGYNNFINIRKTLEDAVLKRVHNTDRKIACLLSGGLDSSLITSLVNKYYSNENRQLETYSIGMKGSEDLKYAKIVADFLGTKHTQIELTEEDFLNAIPQVIESIESYDTTTIRASVGNYLVSKYISENSEAKVIFNGDGSDEVCGGYMYFHYAENPAIFDFECKRLLKDIHFFDVLRSDRSISNNGLEARTPFLDKRFVQNFLSIDKNIRFQSHKKCEKFLLRSAFDDGKTLPKEVLWRTKEAFSDGVSSQTKSWYQIIQDYLNDATNLSIKNYNKITFNYPDTLEKRYYRTIFDKFYNSNVIPYFWMPKFTDAKDASARTLNIYNKKINN